MCMPWSGESVVSHGNAEGRFLSTTHWKLAVTFDLRGSASRTGCHRPGDLEDWRLERHQVQTIDIVYSNHD